MDYRNFKAEDFASTDFFIQWVLHPSVEADAYWMNWLRRNLDKSTEIELGRRIILLASREEEADPSPDFVDRLWNEILVRTSEPDQAVVIRPYWKWVKIAAASVALILLSYIGSRQFGLDQIYYKTSNGETRRVLLADGTQVTLNANSELRVSRDWASTERAVWLKGEGFFHVKKSIGKNVPTKFVVHTDDVDVEVKGTQFAVNTRKQRTRIVLTEGNVHLRLMKSSGNSKIIKMIPGDWVDYSKETQAFSIQHQADTSPASSWKDNRWTFRNVPLSEIGQLITETYGLPVVFREDSVALKKVTGIIPSDNLEDILSSLESILEIKISHQQDKIIVKSKG